MRVENHIPTLEVCYHITKTKKPAECHQVCHPDLFIPSHAYSPDEGDENNPDTLMITSCPFQSALNKYFLGARRTFYGGKVNSFVNGVLR